MKDFCIYTSDGRMPDVQLIIAVDNNEDGTPKDMVIKAQGRRPELLTCLTMLVHKLNEKIPAHDLKIAFSFGVSTDSIIGAICDKLGVEESEDDEG